MVFGSDFQLLPVPRNEDSILSFVGYVTDTSADAYISIACYLLIRPSILIESD